MHKLKFAALSTMQIQTSSCKFKPAPQIQTSSSNSNQLLKFKPAPTNSTQLLQIQPSSYKFNPAPTNSTQLLQIQTSSSNSNQLLYHVCVPCADTLQHVLKDNWEREGAPDVDAHACTRSHRRGRRGRQGHRISAAPRFFVHHRPISGRGWWPGLDLTCECR